MLGDTQCIKSRFIGNNTLEIEYNGYKAIRLHNTDIIVIKDNTYQLFTGGWYTKTTKERINKHSPANVYSRKGQWFIGDVAFKEGIKIDSYGNVISGGGKNKTKDIDKLKKRIKKYVEKIKEPLPQPNGGDCWFCLFKDNEGESWGDMAKNTDHLKQHLKDGYIHGSIICNALIDCGYRKEQLGIIYSFNPNIAKRAVYKYLVKRLTAKFYE